MKKNVYLTNEEIKFLNELKINSVTINSNTFSSAIINHDKNDYFIKIATSDQLDLHIPSMKLDTNHGEYLVEKAFKYRVQPGFYSTIYASNIKKGNESRYWRACFPLKDFKLKNTFFEFDYLEYVNNTDTQHPGLALFEAIKLNLDENEIHLFTVDDNLYIDCITENSKEFFWKTIGNIQACLAFFSGYLIGDECYLLTSEGTDFSSIKSIEHKVLITSEKLAYTPFDETPIPGKQPQISSICFSKLLSLCNQDEHFSNCLFQFIKCLHYSLEIMPCCLSIVIEGFKCIYKSKENTVKVVNNNILEETIKKAITDLLENKFSEDLESDNKDAKNIIISNLYKLFSPPNSDLLLQTFTDAGIPLNDYELQVLDDRNKFVHNVSFHNIKISKFPLANKKDEMAVLQFASMAYIRLIYKLILTKIEYKGFITNIISTNAQYIGLTTTEDEKIVFA